VSAKPARTPTVRLSLRYYLWTEEGGYRLANRLHVDLVARKQAMKQFANTQQRVVEVFVRRLGRQPLFVRARGVVYSFDAQGYLDTAIHAEAVPLALGGIEPRRTKDNLIDIGPVLHHRRWMHQRTWKVTVAIIRQVKADIMGSSHIRTLRGPH
jgi:hypothetical protein